MTSRNRLSRFCGGRSKSLNEHTRSQRVQLRPTVMPSFPAQSPSARRSRPLSPGRRFTRSRGSHRRRLVQYRVGDTVFHKAFGTGIIVSATPMANDTLLEVAFDKVGTKKFFANFARLTKA